MISFKTKQHTFEMDHVPMATPEVPGATTSDAALPLQSMLVQRNEDVSSARRSAVIDGAVLFVLLGVVACAIAGTITARDTGAAPRYLCLSILLVSYDSPVDSASNLCLLQKKAV